MTENNPLAFLKALGINPHPGMQRPPVHGQGPQMPLPPPGQGPGPQMPMPGQGPGAALPPPPQLPQGGPQLPPPPAHGAAPGAMPPAPQPPAGGAGPQQPGPDHLAQITALLARLQGAMKGPPAPHTGPTPNLGIRG